MTHFISHCMYFGNGKILKYLKNFIGKSFSNYLDKKYTAPFLPEQRVTSYCATQVITSHVIIIVTAHKTPGSESEMRVGI
jgi:hypothetical protein